MSQNLKTAKQLRSVLKNYIHIAMKIFFLLLFSISLFQTPLTAQEIEFEISDILIYSSVGEVNIDDTKRARDKIFTSIGGSKRNPILKIIFYKDTDEIHIEIDSIAERHFLNGYGLFGVTFKRGMYDLTSTFKMYKRNRSSYRAKYTWENANAVANIHLNLNNTFSYIRGGTLENTRTNLDGENTRTIRLELNRK